MNRSRGGEGQREGKKERLTNEAALFLLSMSAPEPTNRQAVCNCKNQPITNRTSHHCYPQFPILSVGKWQPQPESPNQKLLPAPCCLSASAIARTKTRKNKEVSTGDW